MTYSYYTSGLATKLSFIFFNTVLPITSNQALLVRFGNEQLFRMNISIVSHKILFFICQDGSIGRLTHSSLDMEHKDIGIESPQIQNL